jgi:acyl carrier protein
MQEDTLQRVKLGLSEVLALDPAKIDDRASLMTDLGADSLDLVELMFVLERQFGVRLTQEDLRLTRQLGLSEEEIHKDEILTPLALEKLRELFPESQQLLVDGVTRRQLAALLTVQQVASSIDAKLAEGT